MKGKVALVEYNGVKVEQPSCNSDSTVFSWCSSCCIGQRGCKCASKHVESSSACGEACTGLTMLHPGDWPLVKASEVLSNGGGAGAGDRNRGQGIAGQGKGGKTNLMGRGISKAGLVFLACTPYTGLLGLAAAN